MPDLQTLRNSLKAPANHSRTCMTSLLTSLSRSVFAMAELMLLYACRWLQRTSLLSRFQEALVVARSCLSDGQIAIRRLTKCAWQ